MGPLEDGIQGQTRLDFLHEETASFQVKAFLYSRDSTGEKLMCVLVGFCYPGTNTAIAGKRNLNQENTLIKLPVGKSIEHFS